MPILSIMLSLKKRYVVLIGLLGGLAIANQDQLKSWYSHIQRTTGLGQSVSQSESNSRIESHQNQDFETPHFEGANSSFQRGSYAPLPSTSPSSLGNQDSKARLVSSSPLEKQARQRNDALKIRIATFNLHAFGETKIQKAAVVESIAKLIRLFDVVAVQHIQSRQQNILPELMDKVNVSDRRYEYCIGPRVGPVGNQQQFAFIFDSDRIETDRQMLYTVEDPQQLMSFEPLVGWFRARTVPSSEAFTFSLVNIRIDALNELREREALPNLMRSVRQDGRLEDDIILAGDFGCSEKELSSLSSSGVLFALEGTPTTVTGESMLDNIIMPARATDEFTGNAGVVDFLRQGNLSIDQAFQISTHMPVWAEFTAQEGGEHNERSSR